MKLCSRVLIEFEHLRQTDIETIAAANHLDTSGAEVPEIVRLELISNHQRTKAR